MFSLDIKSVQSRALAFRLRGCRLLMQGQVCFSVWLLLAMQDVALAQQSGAPTPPSMGEVLQRNIPMFIIVFGIFYFLVIRPQKQEIDAQSQLIASLKKGERVVTSGGILGHVVSVGDDFVTLGLEQNSRLKVEKRHIVKKLDNKTSE